MRSIRSLWLPPWRRAPLRTLRNASLFLGVAVAAFVLGVAGGSRPMLASSAATETLRRDIEVGCRFDVGLRVGRPVSAGNPPPAGAGSPDDPVVVPPDHPQLTEITEALDSAVGAAPGIGPAVITVEGGLGQVVASDPPGGGAGGPRSVVQLVARTEAQDHILVLEDGPDQGAWVPDVVAEDLGVGAGDEVNLNFEGAVVPVPVTGVFRDLRVDRDRHWCSNRNLFESPGGNNPPPPVMLFDQDLLLGVLEEAGSPGAAATWEYAPTGSGWVLPVAERAIASLERIADQTNNPAEPLGTVLGAGRSSADTVGSAHRAERTMTSVESVAGPVALGTVGVAVVMLLAAARSWLQRRSQEVVVLALRGAGPGALAVKAILELLPPMALGAAAGVAGAVAVVRVVGPGPSIEGAAIVEGTVFVVVALVVALGAAAAVVATGVRRVGVGTGGVGGATGPSRRLWWEPPVLVLAGAALYELQTRSSPVVEDTQVDGLLLLFPLLLLAGGAGLLARLVLAARPLAWVAKRLPTPGWLAAHRLSAARARAALIVTGAAVAIGIVVFAGILSSSLSATSYAKAVLGPGSAQIVRLYDPVAPPDLPSVRGISTLVTRTTETGVVRRGHSSADVLGVEPQTFQRGAFWDPSFADRSLNNLLKLLAPTSGTGAVPAIGVGDGLPERFELSVPGEDGDVEIEVTVADRADAFPGYGFRTDKPLVVVNRDELTRRGVVAHAEIWVDDPSPTVIDDLTAAGIPIVFSTRPTESIEGTLLQPQAWAVDYLEVVGLAAGLVTVAGLGLYFAANANRRQLGAAFARRLGLAVHRGAVATALEITSILLAGFVFGATLAWLAARLVFRELDPLPNTPPEAIMQVDYAIVALSGVGVVVTSLLATTVVERRAARASLPELLRHDR